MNDSIVTEQSHGVLTVRLNRVEKKNALTGAMYSAMADAIERAEQDPSIRGLLYTGSGGVFTAGNDLHDFLDNPPQGPDSPVNRFISKMVSTDVPIVAAVDGVAVGIGTTMLLVEACGYRKAAELLMLGEPFTARQALDYGIVSQLCEPEELMERALGAARVLAAKPRDALRATKRLLRRGREPLAERVLAEGEVFSRCLDAPAAREAMQAFFEKRAPNFEPFD